MASQDLQHALIAYHMATVCSEIPCAVKCLAKESQIGQVFTALYFSYFIVSPAITNF